MRSFWAILTLAMVGVIIADLMTHTPGVYAAGNAINGILGTTFQNMLGTPGQSQIQGGP